MTESVVGSRWREQPLTLAMPSEAQGLALSLRALAALDQIEEPRE